MKYVSTPSVLFALSLFALIAYQLKWLIDRYQAEQHLLTESVVNSLKMADYSELMGRMEILKKQNERGQISASLGYDRHENEMRQVTIKYNDSTKPTLNLKMNADTRSDLKSFPDYQTFSTMAYRSIHAGIDQIVGIRFGSLDSLLRLSLELRGMSLDYRLSIVRMNSTGAGAIDSILLSNKPGQIPQIHRSSLQNYLPVYVSLDRQSYCYPFEFTDTYAYCLQLPSTRYTVLKRMGGIIGLSLLTLLIVLLIIIVLAQTIKRKDRLQELQRSFVHNITHELRTPLSVAMTANEALSDTLHSLNEEDTERYRRILQERLADLDQLIDRILTFDRPKQSISAVPTHVSLVVKKVIALLGISIPPTASIDLRIPTDIYTHISDLDLTRILLHLLDNAIKYSDEHIEIIIEARVTDFSVIITVTDRGIGIASKDLPYIFDRFYRVSSGDVHRTRGYGLGLSDVKQTIESYGGFVECQSALKKGSTFILNLPRSNV